MERLLSSTRSGRVPGRRFPMETSDFGRAVDHPTAGRRNRKAAGCVVTLSGATGERPRLSAYRWVTTQLGKPRFLFGSV